MLPSVSVDHVGTPDSVITRLNSPACTCPYRRFANALANANARLGVIVGRYPFDVELFHLLLHAGLSRRTYGPFAGRRQVEAEAAYGNIDRAPGVEPPGAFAARVTGALRSLAGRARDGPVAVVAHEAVNQVALARLVPELAGLPARIGQRTGCWNRLELVAGTWLAPVVDAVPGDGHRPWPEETGAGRT